MLQAAQYPVEPNNLVRSVGVRWRIKWACPRNHYSPEVVPLAEQEVPLSVETVAHLPQPGVTAAALEAVLVPEHVQGLQAEENDFYGK